ncbi:hypothetical protein LMG29739_06325 [Paraburkholderia solisilvae]|uniref:Uncharacterized protein n=1 Tax=Paraburkholderia solisilvae TaxID=624376 RepID=A0A6J5F1Q0_9BURK|nr:hypothetical protein LMG29739_06325 [Paraburkholderia solisilvae]
MRVFRGRRRGRQFRKRRAQAFGLRLHIRDERVDAGQHVGQIEIGLRDARPVRNRQRRTRRRLLLRERRRIHAGGFAKVRDPRGAAPGARIVRRALPRGHGFVAGRQCRCVVVGSKLGLVEHMRGSKRRIRAVREYLLVVRERTRRRLGLVRDHHRVDIERQRILMHSFAVILRDAEHQFREEPQRVECEAHLFDPRSVATPDKRPCAQRGHVPFDARLRWMHAGQAIRLAALQIAGELLVGRRAQKQIARRIRRETRHVAAAPSASIATCVTDARLPVEPERAEIRGRVADPVAAHRFVRHLEVRHRAAIGADQCGKAVAVESVAERIARMPGAAECARIAERHRDERLRFADA